MKSESLGNYSLEGMAVVKQAALARITVRKDDVGKAALQLMIKDIDEKIDSHVDQILSQYIVKAMEDERKAKT